MWVRILLPLQIAGGYAPTMLLTGTSGSFQPQNSTKITEMSKIGTYVKESYKELTTKVAWPSWDKLQSSAWLVMIASLILAVVIWVIDLIIRVIMNGIYQL